MHRSCLDRPESVCAHHHVLQHRTYALQITTACLQSALGFLINETPCPSLRLHRDKRKTQRKRTPGKKKSRQCIRSRSHVSDASKLGLDEISNRVFLRLPRWASRSSLENRTTFISKKGNRSALKVLFAGIFRIRIETPRRILVRRHN